MNSERARENVSAPVGGSYSAVAWRDVDAIPLPKIKECTPAQEKTPTRGPTRESLALIARWCAPVPFMHNIRDDDKAGEYTESSRRCFRMEGG